MKTATIAAFGLLLSGCASVMRDAPSQAISSPASGKAKVVFMRSSVVLGGIGCDLFEVVEGQLRLVGQLPNGKRVAYETTPGKKVFMAYGAAADFMLADLSAGKTYYSIVRPNWGTTGFAPTPIRSADLKSKEIQEWILGTKLIELEPKAAETWLAENRQRFQGIYADYWSRFERKNAQEKFERTLLPTDGQ